MANNHQGEIEWHHHADATANLERERYLSSLLATPAMTAPKVADAFLRQPLCSSAYEQFLRHRPLVIRPRLDPAIIGWCLTMLRNCTAARYELKKARMVPLAEYSRDMFRAARGTRHC